MLYVPIIKLKKYEILYAKYFKRFLNHKDVIPFLELRYSLKEEKKNCHLNDFLKVAGINNFFLGIPHKKSAIKINGSSDKDNYIVQANKNIKTINENKKNKTHDRMEKLKKEGKSLLLGAPKKECSICHKFIESHLHPIHYNAHPSQIFKWMYLGNFDTACNISDLRRLGITYVLNLAGECKNTLLPKNITEYHLKTKDLADFDLIEYFEKANDFINKVRNSGGTMLIHCKYGVSRSPTFVAAYLTKYFGFSVQSALNFIRKKRPMINPNEGFLYQLEKYEQSFKKIRK